MSVEVPAWLTKEFLQDILRKSEKDSTIGVTKIDVEAATNAGDNYASVIYRISVALLRNGKTEVTSLIAKTVPAENIILYEVMIGQGVFNVEITMMEDTLAKMNRLLGEDDRISARFFYANIKEPSVLIAEDLKPLGFRMADRQAGLDLVHSLLAIRNLAKFHASSVAVCEKEPEQRGWYRYGMYGRNCETSKHFFNSHLKLLAGKMANWPELARYSEKMLRLSRNIYETAMKIVVPLENEFNVINHGDCWVNNMLFQYDDNGKPVKQMFVDFQLPSWGSPAQDLQYFINTSLSTEVDLNHRDQLLAEYRKTLASTMTRLGCKRSPLTEPELTAAMDRLEICAMLPTLAILPMILVKKDEVQKIEEIMANKNGSSLENECFREVLIRRIPEYDKKGLLDL